MLIEKPKAEHDGEGADDRDRHGEQRDDRGAPGLQEHDDHQHHQDHRFQQGMNDRVDRFAHELGRVVHDAVCRRLPGSPFDSSAIVARTSVGQLQRVGAGRLEDRDGDGRLVVEQRAQGVRIGTELEARHVLQLRDGAVGTRA